MEDKEKQDVEEETVEIKSTKTISKELYDQKVRELSKANKRIKELEGVDTDVTAKDARIAELEKELETEKVNAQLLSKLTEMGCTDLDYALYKLHQANPDLKLGEDGKLGNIDELASAVKTSNPNVFMSEDSKEIEVSKLGDGKHNDDGMTKSDFLKKPYNERAAFAAEHPEEFKNLMKEV